MNIKKIKGIITKATDLSPTTRDIEITVSEPLEFIAGSFVNIFMDINGEKVRRAYSISSSDQEHHTINLSVRLTINGKMTPQFWREDIVGLEIELMGPLGLNTANKMISKTKYLAGFGIGAGVIKSLLDHFSKDSNTEKIVVLLGHRSEKENLYKEYFTQMQKESSKIEIEYIFSKPEDTTNKTGYIQNHISQYLFSNSDVYICGQEAACNQLVEKIKETNPIDCAFFVEAFH